MHKFASKECKEENKNLNTIRYKLLLSSRMKQKAFSSSLSDISFLKGI